MIQTPGRDESRKYHYLTTHEGRTADPRLMIGRNHPTGYGSRNRTGHQDSWSRVYQSRQSDHPHLPEETSHPFATISASLRRWLLAKRHRLPFFAQINSLLSKFSQDFAEQRASMAYPRPMP